MPVASKPAQRARPHLEANMNLIRNLVVNVPHTYWNRHMSPSVTWTVYITHVLPPANKNQLRMRLVAEARQTLADGEGEGMVIGPHVRLTRLLVELEKETKRDNPPAYYRYRPETSRKACDQLKVAGMTGSPWLLKEYLQGEKLLTETVLPPRSMRVPGFVPTFTDAQLEQLLTNRPPGSSRGGAKRKDAAAPDRRLRQRNADVRPLAVAECACHADAPLAASSVAVRTCSRCPAGVFMSIKGSGKTPDTAVETGFACEQCQGSLCGSCAFAELAAFAQRRDLREHLAIEAPCACGMLPQRGPGGERLFMATAAVAPTAWFGDPEALRDCAASGPYVVGDGAALDVERTTSACCWRPGCSPLTRRCCTGAATRRAELCRCSTPRRQAAPGHCRAPTATPARARSAARRRSRTSARCAGRRCCAPTRVASHGPRSTRSSRAPTRCCAASPCRAAQS